jgi:hypothetical protein
MTNWLLEIPHTTDGIFRILVVVLAAIIIVKYGTLLEEEYNKRLTDLYVYPWWRIISVLLIVAGAAWCPRVGLMIALVMFFYLSDMNILLTPLPNL